MNSLWLKNISLLLLCCIANANILAQSDTIKSLLEKQLLNKEFNNEAKVLEYLELTGKMYSQSPSDALFFVRELEKKLEAEDNTNGKAYLLSKKGTYFWLQGIYDASLKAYFAALGIFEENNNQLEVVKTLNNIGETYKKQKDYTQSAKFIKLALAKLGEIEELSPELILVNLGQLFMLQDNYDSATIFSKTKLGVLG
jgi:tetratricopeptide (TPR) repeat protein